MSESFYTARAAVRIVDGVHRRVRLEDTGVSFDVGVHGPIKAHYGIDSTDLPLPVDYIVGATGG